MDTASAIVEIEVSHNRGEQKLRWINLTHAALSPPLPSLDLAGLRRQQIAKVEVFLFVEVGRVCVPMFAH